MYHKIPTLVNCYTNDRKLQGMIWEQITSHQKWVHDKRHKSIPFYKLEKINHLRVYFLHTILICRIQPPVVAIHIDRNWYCLLAFDYFMANSHSWYRTRGEVVARNHSASYTVVAYRKHLRYLELHTIFL